MRAYTINLSKPKILRINTLRALIFLLTLMALLVIITAAPALGGNPVFIEKVPLEYGYIKADGTIEPSTLPIERQGNLYTLKADLTNTSLTIMKNDAIFDGSGFTLTLSPDIWDYGNSADPRITIQQCQNVIIQNTRFKNGGLAINIVASSRVTILGNNFEAGSLGVWVGSESPHCTIVGNNFDNVHTAISGHSSVKYLNVAYNNISKGTFACYFNGEFAYSNVTRNNIEYTFYGVYLFGLNAWEGHDNTFSENNFISNRVGGIIVAVLWRPDELLPDEKEIYTDKVYCNYFRDNGFGNSEISDIILYKDSDINQLPQTTPLFNNIQIQLYREPTSQPFNLDEYLYKTIPPRINVQSPTPQTYNSSAVSLIFEVDKPISTLTYSLDDQEPTTLTGNITLSLSNGAHNITIHATDTYGNKGTSQTINFDVEAPFPNVPIVPLATACAGGALAAGAALLFYFKKRKH